ncbi:MULTISPECIES: hypothetical protein [Thermus]|uniref:hypothetical protein n=1 Tax=Thermus sp. TaxID=275 RepID=UPI00298EE75D|nr:hypothetical protein [Thermus sp.]MDW8358105.1 hypothetical protein [Thermus sp.]
MRQKDVETAFARIQGLLAKAVQEEEDDELARDLDEDLEAYARLKAKKAKKAQEAQEDEEDQDLEMDFEDEEDKPTAKARHEDDEEDEDDEAEPTLGAVLSLIVRALDGIHQNLEALRAATLELGKQNVAVAKGVAELEEAVYGVLDAPRLPKSGRRVAKAAEEPRLNPGELVAKAVAAKDAFSAYDVAVLESMLNRGDLEGVRKRFAPHQLKVLGLI